MPTTVFRETCGDFQAVGLRDAQLEVAVAPGCGAKIIRLLDRRTHREWTWSASPARRLHRNAVGDAFETSPLVGVDECIPTVASCTMAGQTWPDHGEAWSRAWELDEHALHEGVLVTSIRLQTVPFLLQRRIELVEGKLRLDYRLQNLGRESHPYAWALHPLLAFRDGDRLELPGPVGRGRVDSACRIADLASGSVADWPEPAPGFRLDELLAGAAQASLKLYLPTPRPAELAIRNTIDRTALRVRYGPAEWLPFLGIWVTRGGWNGYDHFAVEPTNVTDDRADRIDAGLNPAAALPGGAQRAWYVELDFGTS